MLQVLDHNSTKMRADHAVGEVSLPVIDVIHSNGTPQAARSMPLQPMPERDGPASPGGVTDLADSGRKNKWLGKLEFHVNFVPLKGARMQVGLQPPCPPRMLGHLPSRMHTLLPFAVRDTYP